MVPLNKGHLGTSRAQTTPLSGVNTCNQDFLGRAESAYYMQQKVALYSNSSFHITVARQV